EPGGFLSKPLQDMVNAVLGDPDTPFRFYFIPDGKSLAALHLEGDLIGETEKVLEWGEGMTSFLPKQVKLFADGAIYSQLMQMKDGYLDGHKGEWMMNLDIFERSFQKYWDAGYQLVIHQNGDAGLERVLNTLETNMRRNPRHDHRTTAVHFGFSTKEQVIRLKALGAIVSANPYYTVALADKYSEAGVGPERAQEMVRLGDVERAGISFSFHSDMPMAPEKPVYLMDCAVNRITSSGKVAGPNQRVSREKALEAVTIDAAYSLRLEDEMGSIEAGKMANFTVLEDNPLTIAAKHIKDIKVWGTVHEGRVLPVTNEIGAKNLSQVMPAKQMLQDEIVKADQTTGHDHDHHSGCICVMNQALASTFFKTDQ
ncbi:MAG: amidohydrolase family protein, partial [bacterium]|nr:amidohydrolase family protein [bacterium]